MKLVWLVGSQAVGKMTVGQELMKKTKLRLFHNHMTIEPVLEIFGTWNRNAIMRMRQVVFEEFAASDAYGLMFTYVMAFDQKEEWDYVQQVNELFAAHGAEIYFVELVADRDVRLMRNETENRLQNKASKRDVEASRQRIFQAEEKFRCESLPGEVPFDNYLRIDTTCLTAAETAKQIKEYFKFE